MPRLISYIVIVMAVLFVHNCYSQQYLTGTIYDAKSDSIVQDVLIINLTTNKSGSGSREGKFSIAAAEGHRIAFSAIGYTADTITVAFHMLVTGHDISLKSRYNMLEAVVVTDQDYQQDSLERREQYRKILDNDLAGITGRNTPQHGFGIVLSPASYFSGKARKERKLKKKLIYDEQMEYVDFRFSRSLVQRYSGLKGDSLQTFMLKYRPSYEFCRQSNQEDMINYINEKLKIYFRREEKN